MAKIPFTKLKCKINDSIKEVKLNDEITIEVKQYLPIQEKLQLIGDVVMQAHDQDANFSNPVKAAVFRDLEVVFAYTNLTFTEKQREDFPKLYDMLLSSGYLIKIIEVIPEKEYEAIVKGVEDSIEAVYKYQNSVFGVLDSIVTDYGDLNFNIEDLKEKLAGLDNMELLKSITSNLG